MALVLGARVGDIFYIGRRRIDVTSIGGPDRIIVKRDDGRTFIIGANRATEVFRDVFISAGPRCGGRGPRLAFEAPQTILIGRGQ
jgi:hypothetical protein